MNADSNTKTVFYGRCPHCKTQLELSDQRVICPHCDETFFDYREKSPTAEEEDYVDVLCPHCSAECEAKRRDIGQEEACPACGVSFTISENSHDDSSSSSDTSSAHTPVSLGVIGQILDGFTKGKYSRYKNLNYNNAARPLAQLKSKFHDSINILKTELQTCKEKQQDLIQKQHREQVHKELQGHTIDEVLSLDGVGKTTIEKLQDRGINNLHDLYGKAESTIHALPYVRTRAKISMVDFVKSAVSEAENRPLSLNPSSPTIQELVENVLKEDALNNILPFIRSQYKEIRRSSKSYRPVSFIRFVFSPDHYENIGDSARQALASAAGTWEECCSRMAGRHFAFENLSQDEYLRGMGLLQRILGDDKKGTSAPSQMHRFGLPSDKKLVERVENFQLNTSHVKSCILRRYQEFGASFALVQKHTLLGDELGLGKTVEALAVIAHLATIKSGLRALVLVPASLRENWYREVLAKTSLRPVKVMPSANDSDIRSWMNEGDIAIISYATLRSIFEELLPFIPSLDIVVCDEAQYIKNPNAGRSIATQRIIDRAEYTLLMTGTPIQNHPQEFAAIVNAGNCSVPGLDRLQQGYQPPSPEKFKEEVQYVYLRRNKEDVLEELPDLIESTDWVGFPDDELHYHLKMIEDGCSLMYLRQHAVLGALKQSEKLARIRDLAEEYVSDKRNVVIFSYFRKVISELNALFPDAGVITGDVSVKDRMWLIERFSEQNGGKGNILIGQIMAGGVGLNMQAASAALIVEPQLNPAVENQAIARAHRMGQRSDVNVHRVLAKSTVEEGLVKMLEKKQKYMDDYARDSLLKEQSSSAISGEEVNQIIENQRYELRKELAA